jgi:methionine-rich copper-binding protein CopC
LVAHGEPSDVRTLVLVPAQPLKPGVYKVTWHVVGVDTHGVEGEYVFTVR